MKKVFIVYASAGAGHQKAAEALYEYLKRTRPDLCLKLIDILDYSNHIVKFSYSKGYIFLITKFPWAWYLLYRLSSFFANNYFRLFSDYLACQPFVDLLKKEKPDVVVSTHFLTSGVLSVFKKKHPQYLMGQSTGDLIPCHSRESGNPDSRDSPVKPGNDRIPPFSDRLPQDVFRLITIITDYTLHPYWIGDGVDSYIASCEYVKDCLLTKKIQKDKIKVYGIPVKEKFYLPSDRKTAAQKLGVDPLKFTALIMTGAVGIGPIKEIVQALADDVQLLVICGKNQRLFDRLTKLNLANVKVYPLIDYVDELMSVSDVVLTKAGGLTISESLAKGLPMIFFSSIPGLETANEEVICESGAGIKGKSVEEIKNTLFSLKANPSLYQDTKQKAINLRKVTTLKDLSMETSS